jgi:hypothetical protein
MDDQANFYPDGVTQVLKLIREELGQEYTYFDDELLEMDQSQLPCVMVFEGQGGVRAGATMTDDLGETISIVVALNLLDDINSETNTVDYENLTGARLRRLVKGQDPATQQWLPGTVMHALRTKFTMDNGTVGNTVELDFSPNKRGANVFTKEAYITIALERIVAVPERT